MMSGKSSYAIAAALIVTGILLAMSEIGIRMITVTNPQTGMQRIGRSVLLPYRPDAEAAHASWDRAGRSTYFVRDEDLGWAIKGNGASVEYTATSHGFRGPRNWATTSSIPQGKIRISVYGESFTHGDEVAFKDTWSDQLQHLRTDLEVLNFAVSGHGTDQSLLRFRRDGRKFNAHFHILGIHPENLLRNLSVVRFYLTLAGDLGTSKPRFVLSSGNLAVVNSPVLSRQAFLDTVLQTNVSPVVEQDYWYSADEQRFPFYYHMQTIRAAFSVYKTYQRRKIRNRLYFDREGEALKVTTAIAEAFKTEVEDLGSRAYISIMPMRDFLVAREPKVFPLIEMLKARSIPVLDFGPTFASRAKEVGIDALFLPSGHLTALGNRLIAEEINRELSREFDRAPR